MKDLELQDQGSHSNESAWLNNTQDESQEPLDTHLG